MIEDSEFLYDTSVSSFRCSVNFPASAMSWHQGTIQPSTSSIAGLVSSLPVGPLEFSALAMEPCHSATSAIESRLFSPYPSSLSLKEVPARVHADRPVELELADVGLGAGAGASVDIASWISAHTCLAIAVEVPGQPRGEVSVLVNARPSGGSWIARALVRPSAWANAASVTVVSLSLAGRPLPCDCLPATLQVGYNHAPAPAGAVYAAARAGDVPALRAALDAGGSTEEADEVRGGGRRTHGRAMVEERACTIKMHLLLLQGGRTASYWAAGNGNFEAIRTLLAAGANPSSADILVREGGKVSACALAGCFFLVGVGGAIGMLQASR